MLGHSVAFQVRHTGRGSWSVFDIPFLVCGPQELVLDPWEESSLKKTLALYFFQQYMFIVEN